MNERDNRRKEILEILKMEERPISGSELADRFQVSRQVIVQDIALLKAEENEIISTNRGYKLYKKDRPTRVFKVNHKDADIERELNEIVDLGGEIIDVFVWHKAYGKIEARLDIKSRKDVKNLIEKIKSGVSSPLKKLTKDYHYHTIAADDEKTLDEVYERLKELDFIVKWGNMVKVTYVAFFLYSFLIIKLYF